MRDAPEIQVASRERSIGLELIVGVGETGRRGYNLSVTGIACRSRVQALHTENTTQYPSQANIFRRLANRNGQSRIE
jgi:hypothetical protein